MLKLGGGDVDELQADIELKFFPVIDPIVRDHLGLDGRRRAVGEGRKLEDENRLALEVHIEEHVVVFNPRIIGLQIGPAPGDVVDISGDFFRERFLSDRIKYEELHLDAGLDSRAMTSFDMEYSSKELNRGLQGTEQRSFYVWANINDKMDQCQEIIMRGFVRRPHKYS